MRDASDVSVFSREWTKGGAYWSVGGVHSSMVGILFGDRGFTVEEVFTVVQGRILGIDCVWGGRKLRVVCVYAPVTAPQRVEAFQELAKVLIMNRVLIVGGDFNVDLEGGGSRAALCWGK